MSLDPSMHSATRSGAGRCQWAFSLTELLVAIAILSIVMAGLLVSNLFGVRLHQITKVKLGASDDARSAISLLISEIRSAKLIRIGTGSATSFGQAPDGTPQQGNAIQIYPSTNTNVFVRYYRNSADNTLMRITNGSTTPRLIASYVSNHVVFTAENHLGAVLTNSQNNRVIGLTLQFYQVEFPVVTIGPGNYYDFYQLRTRVTRRMLE